MKLALRMLLLDILFALTIIKPKKYAKQKCQLSYLMVNEADDIYRRTILNKEWGKQMEDRIRLTVSIILATIITILCYKPGV